MSLYTLDWLADTCQNQISADRIADPGKRQIDRADAAFRRREYRANIHRDIRDRYEWVDKAQELERRGDSSDALRMVYRELDERLSPGKHSLYFDCDAFLARANPRSYSTDFLLAFLTITLIHHNHLRNRPAFFEKVKSEMKFRGFDPREILDGLG